MSLSFVQNVANPAEYMPPAPQIRPSTASQLGSTVVESDARHPVQQDMQPRVSALIDYIAAQGFVFEPWQIAAFITAVRTKPFVILAGISGTGKTKLPSLVAEATHAKCRTVPVRPDWTDSSDLLGHEQLGGAFHPGELLRVAKEAQSDPDTQYFFVLDEMNIARVEYYFAEVLSHLEQRRNNGGRIVSDPLLPYAPKSLDGESWDTVRLPSNLCIVGSVNMDETTFGFSKKVLDRAFVIEFSTITLSHLGDTPDVQPAPSLWESAYWLPSALSLATHPSRNAGEVGQMIEVLTRVNKALELGQLQFGYRVRDEIVMFCLAAEGCSESFATSDSGPVDPLDLAIAMKVLPRIQGSGATIRKVIESLQKWASPSNADTGEAPGQGDNAGFPFCGERLSLMANRLKEFGYTQFWL
jgi:hypothetical protein